MNTVEINDTIKTQPWYEAQLRTPQAGESRAINVDSLNKTADEVKNLVLLNKLSDYDDVKEKVVCKLTALTEIFEFFQYTKGMADFRAKTIPGICYLIDDCIDELEGLKK
jgi:hypothetical protein